MTNQNSDPISQIKKEEENSRKKIEESRKENELKLQKLKEDLAEKCKEFEESLRQRGIEKLETVKKEASELLKSRMATSDNNTNKLVSEAESKKDQAVKQVQQNFLEHIKA
ncbi:MAG: hypothetical protein O3B47_01400 [bacterium]|nr:hypothetical protein [bacterium]